MMGKKKKDKAKKAKAEESTEPIGDDSQVVTEDAEVSDEELFDNELDKLRAENAELKIQWARSQADYQNQKRRAQSDYEAGVRRTMAPFLGELLQVLDYLDMALAAPVTSDDAKNLVIGIEMTRTQFQNALANQGVKEISTKGVFDARVHEATKAEVDETVEPGTILSVVRKGYQRGDEVLRHAHVVVSKSEAEGAENPEVVKED